MLLEQQQLLSEEDWTKIDPFLVTTAMGKKCLGKVKVASFIPGKCFSRRR